MFSGTAIGLTAHQMIKKSATTDGKQALPYNKGGIRDFEEQERKRHDVYGEQTVMARHVRTDGNPEELPKDIQMLNVLYKCNGCELYSRRHDQVTAYLQMELNGEKPADNDEDFMNNFDMYKSKSMSEARYISQTYGIIPGLKFHTEKVCPHCKKQQRLGYSLDDKEHEWLKHHAHCLELDDVGLIRVNELHEKLRQTIKDQKSAEKFLEYNNLAKTFEEATRVHGVTLEEAAETPLELDRIKVSDVGGEFTELRAGKEVFTVRNFPDGLHVIVDMKWIKTDSKELEQLIRQAIRKG